MDITAAAKYLDRVAANVQENGFAVQCVAPYLGQPGPDFAYTVGLTAAGLPELLMAGLAPTLMHEVLHFGAQHTLRHELTPGDFTSAFCSMPLRVDEIDSKPASAARALYPDQTVRLLQLVWPDNAGSYPDDPAWSLGRVQTLAIE